MVSHFEGWKKAFELDPINRKKAGVRRYRIYRPIEDASYVIIDLEFENLKDAQDTLTGLRSLWNNVEGQVMMHPKTRILDIVETMDV
jgi:hypothetical protein